MSENNKRILPKDENGRFLPNPNTPDIEDVLPMFIAGDSYNKIAQFFNIPISTLHKLCSLPLNVPRVRQALDLSAQAWADKAEAALLSAPSTMPEVGRARELAAFYKWMAAKRSPRTFGDHQTIDVNKTTQRIVVKAAVEN